MNFSEVTRFTAGETKIAQLKDTDGTVLWTDPQFTRADGTSPAYQHTMVSGTQKYAEVDEVGGKSVVWNQLCENGNFADNSCWLTNAKFGTMSIANNKATFTATNVTGSHSIRSSIEKGGGISFTIGHKYYISLFVTISENTQSFCIGIGGAQQKSSYLSANANEKTRFDVFIVSDQTYSNKSFYLYPKSGTGLAVGGACVYENVMCIDLTPIESATGLTFTTVAQFKAWAKSAGKDLDNYQAYDTGSVLHFGCNEIVSTDSDNQQIDSIAIPAEVRALEGYGWSAGSAKNYVDWQRKKFVKCVGSQSVTGAIGDTITLTGCDTTATSFLCDTAIGTLSAGVLTLTAAVTNKSVYYPLGTPVETDISQYLDNNLLEVEAGGTVTLKQPNDTEMPLPNSIKYLVKGV